MNFVMLKTISDWKVQELNCNSRKLRGYCFNTWSIVLRMTKCYFLEIWKHCCKFRSLRTNISSKTELKLSIPIWFEILHGPKWFHLQSTRFLKCHDQIPIWNPIFICSSLEIVRLRSLMVNSPKKLVLMHWFPPLLRDKTWLRRSKNVGKENFWKSMESP